MSSPLTIDTILSSKGNALVIVSDDEDPIEASPPPTRLTKRRRYTPTFPFVPSWKIHFSGFEGCKITVDNCAAELQTCFFPFLGLLDDCVREVSALLTVNPPIKIYGKPGVQHRNVGFFTDEATVRHYNYSTGNTMPAQPMTNGLALLLEAINLTFGRAGFNAVLVNCYKDGSDYIGAHSDKEDHICPHYGVLSLSWGATRIFRIRNKETKHIVCDVPLQHGMLCDMNGTDFQRCFTHEILKDEKIGRARYSFTFRRHKTTQ